MPCGGRTTSPCAEYILSGSFGSLDSVCKVLLKPVLGGGGGCGQCGTITLLHMNRLNKIESTIFVSLMFSDLHSEYIFSIPINENGRLRLRPKPSLLTYVLTSRLLG